MLAIRQAEMLFLLRMWAKNEKKAAPGGGLFIVQEFVVSVNSA